MKYIYSISIFLFLLSAPFFVHAYELRVAPDVSINENYVSDSNLYLASLHFWFNTTFEKDLVSASINQTIAGTIFGDSTLLGKNVFITGESYGDTRVIADTVHVSGVTNSDLIIVARHVILDSDSIINGDTLILADTLDFSGQFLGQTQITANKITVAGSIVGQTTLTGSKIIFNPGSKVTTEISYFSPQRAVINSGADIQKNLNFNQIETIKQNDVIKRIFFGFVSFWAIIKLIATLFVLFVLTHLFRVPVQRVLEGIQDRVGFTILTGVVSILGIPLLTILLFGSLVLIPVSIIVFSMFIIMIILLPSMSAIITAYFYQKYIRKENKISIQFNTAALALIALTFVGFIPYIGSIIIYALYILSFGAIVQYLYSMVRRKKINF